MSLRGIICQATLIRNPQKPFEVSRGFDPVRAFDYVGALFYGRPGEF
jgi:hypothetical protein